MGAIAFTRYTCDRCAIMQEVQGGGPFLPNSWSTIKMSISPAQGKATVENLDRVLCDQCTVTVKAVIVSVQGREKS